MNRAMLFCFFLTACSGAVPQNIVAYRVNKSGAIGGVDEGSAVIHWATDPPNIWHDVSCTHGGSCRTWVEVVGSDGSKFVEVK